MKSKNGKATFKNAVSKAMLPAAPFNRTKCKNCENLSRSLKEAGDELDRNAETIESLLAEIQELKEAQRHE